MIRRILVLALALAGCADGKSTLTVTVTSDATVAGIDHFAVTVTEYTTPPRSVGPITVASSGATIPPDQTFALVFDKDVHSVVDVSVVALDGSGGTLATGDSSAEVTPSEHEEVTVNLPGGGGNDMSVGDGGGAGGDLAGTPDLLPEPGCPPNGDGGTISVGDPCSAADLPHACYGGTVGTCGIGACRPGVQYCLDGQWGPCSGEVDPQPEVCDGRDQDCNGTADDGLGTVSCGLGECAVTVAACTAGKPTVCTPKNGVSESCDGKDNDCNGAIDEIGCSAIHVAPTGNDGTGDGTAALPFRTIAHGITVAAALTSSPKLVYAAAGATCPATFNYNEQINMVDGVDVYGGYESTNWTRGVTTCQTQLAKTDANPTVGFDVNIVHTTILDGFYVTGKPGVLIKGSKGAVLSNDSLDYGCSFGDSTCMDVNITDYFGAPATPLITRNHFNAYYYAIHSSKSAPIIIGNCEARDPTGHCITNCTFPNNWTKGIVGNSFGGVAIWLDYSPGAVVAENQICGNSTLLEITGDAQGTLVRGNSIAPSATAATGVYAPQCNGSPWILDNTQLSGGPTANGANSIGVFARACDLRIDHNVLITGAISGTNGDSHGIWCARDGGTLRESRCQIVGNTIAVNKSTSSATGAYYGVRCDDVSCARIEGNTITGGSAINSYGLVLGRSGTLVARNIIDSGCMSSTTGVSVAVDTTDSYARFENNLIRGGACGGNVYGVREHIINSGDEVDLHSNTIQGGGVAAGCAGHALDFEVGATTPATARGLVRNNILLPGPCNATAWDIYEGAAISPRVLSNNDLAPVPTLYHSNGGGDLTTKDMVNALPGASANFSADPMLNADGIHLNTGSMCIDTGTALGAPSEDYDAMSRPRGAGFDVGADEK